MVLFVGPDSFAPYGRKEWRSHWIGFTGQPNLRASQNHTQAQKDLAPHSYHRQVGYLVF